MGLYISYARGKNVVLTSLDAAVQGKLERTAALNGMVQGHLGLSASLNADVVLFTTYEKTAAMNAVVYTIKQGHIVDSNTLWLFRMDEESGITMIDAKAPGTGYDLTNGADAAHVGGQIGISRRFTPPNQYISGSLWNDTRITNMRTACANEWTLEWWMKIPTGASMPTGAFILMFCVANQGYSRWLGVTCSTPGRQISVTWTLTPSTDTWASSVGQISYDTWTHVAVRKRSVGGGLYVVDFYLNGVFDSTSASASNATSGWAPSSETLYIGRNNNTTDYPYDGYLDDMRFSKVLRTPTEIAESYARGAFGITPIATAQKFYYKLDGDLSDATGNGWTGSPTNIAYGAGKVNSGAVFSSGTSLISIPSLSLGTQFTLAMWIYPTANGTQGLMMENSSTHAWFRTGTGAINWYDPTGAPFYPATLTAPINTWTHIALTHDGTTIRHYINGVLDVSSYTRPAVNFTPTRIGVDQSGNAFTGTIDEVGAWTRVLSATDIAAIYNAGTGNPYTYINVNSGEWLMTGSMIVRRTQAPVVLLNTGKVLISGGNNSGADSLSESELYDPSAGTWAATGSRINPRSDAASVLLPSGKVLAAGGYATGTYRATCELYDPAATTWATTGSMSVARSAFKAVMLLTGKVLVIGGENPITAVCELYNPATETWATTGPMSTVRQYPQVALLQDGRVLVSGGYTGSTMLSSAEIYDPAAGTWSPTGSMIAGTRYTGSAITLSSGKVLVAGGSRVPGPTLVTATEIFDPATGTWSFAGYLTAGRDAFPSIAMLPSGNVALMGGRSPPSTYLNSVEIYDPNANRWNTANPMSRTRAYANAVTLPNGKVLIAGAYTGSDGIDATELYSENSNGLAAYLAAYWKLDGNSLDVTGNRNGTDTGITYSGGNGKINSGAGFGTLTSRIAISSLALGPQFTLMAWIKPTSLTPTYNGFLGTSGSFGLVVMNTGKLSYYYASADHFSTGAISVGVWNHVALVHDGATSRFYINGVVDASTYANTQTFNLVYIGYDGSEGILAAMDEIGAWNRALTAAEVAAIYNAGSGIQYPF